ncbi:ABC efflux pump, inner membrane subunit [Candidatus Koribacter versatilis Ellin345]|uniref:ABC efflux pump, inner membrane subunit n=1 Tax=Koribacter versatilis (strain Ellin345) TaxID=204669 RepID=Q1IQB6_KORVE|nr:ABC transporter permease [Candidatus Koribacter versatilis]ABF40934.1 ABC efflux pump, inner membrane subunit [Candidatus Koribacter versatilis Ellin345]
MNFRYALRQAIRRPAFSLAVILTVALGVGGVTAIFTIVHAVLLKPLAYRDPSRLVALRHGATPMRYEEFAAGARTLDSLGAYAGGQDELSLTGYGEPQVLKAARVSANWLGVVGVSPMLGRSFFDSEDREGGPNAAMISAELWHRVFHDDRHILGQTIALDGSTYVVIGVLPPRFQFPIEKTDIWVTHPEQWLRIPRVMQRNSPTLNLFARLKPGVDLATADAELQVLQKNYIQAHPGMLDAKPDTPVHWEQMKDLLVSDIAGKLWMLLGAVTLVLLLVCSNVASLLLVRASARSHEFAVRAAIGASRARIVAQLLTESLLYSFVGGALGLLLAWIGVAFLKQLPGMDLPRSGEIQIDFSVLGFALFLSLVTGLIFGLMPSLSASRTDLNRVLRASGEAGIASDGRRRFLRLSLRSVFVLSQVGISVVLLIGTVLLIRSLANVYRVDPGFESARVVTMSLALSPQRYDTAAKQVSFYEEIVRRVQALPGVQGAAVTRTVPMAGFAMSPIQVAEREFLPLNQRPLAALQSVTPGYLSTMSIPLLRGRDIGNHDRQDAPPIALISVALAKQFWPQYPAGPDPIGQHLVLGTKQERFEIVGICGDVHQAGLDTDVGPEMYTALAQQPPVPATFVVRTASDPLAMTGAIRAQILQVDPDQAVSDVATMGAVIDESEGQLRTMMRLLAIFACVAMVIAVVGLYGFTAYAVEQREREIGIRRALGANRVDVLALILRQTLFLTVAGSVAGVGAAMFLNRLLTDMLFEVKGTDVLTYVTAALLFVTVAVVASYGAAKRAATIDPIIAIRSAN